MAAAASSSEVSMKSCNETGRIPMEGQNSNSTTSGVKRGIVPVVFSVCFLAFRCQNFVDSVPQFFPVLLQLGTPKWRSTRSCGMPAPVLWSPSLEKASACTTSLKAT